MPPIAPSTTKQTEHNRSRRLKSARFAVFVLLTLPFAEHLRAQGSSAADLADGGVSEWTVLERSCTDSNGVVTHCDEELLVEEAILTEIERKEATDQLQTEAVQKDLLVPTSASTTVNNKSVAVAEIAEELLVIPSESARETEERASGESYISSLVDIYFLGRLVSTSRISHDELTLRFESPDQILDNLIGVREHDRIAGFLQQAMPMNADRVCNPWRENNLCGWIETDSVAAIFDENRLRVDLFVAEEFLSYKARYRKKYLPQARDRSTSVISTRMVAKRLDQEDATFYGEATGVLSYGQGNLSMNANYNTETEESRLRTLSLTHFFPDHEIQAGTFTYSPGGYLANLDVMGLRWHSSLKSRRDTASLLGSKIEVFLSQRSIVQIAVGERIYASGSYEAGNHILDTSMLPEGTYEVEVRIDDPVAGVRVEKHLFTRSKLLPPAGQGSYGFTLGSPVDTSGKEDYPEPEDEVVFGADYGRRLNGRTAWNLGIMQLREDSLMQAELIRFNRFFLWKARALAGESDTWGLGLSMVYKNGYTSASLTADQYNSDIVFDSEESTALQKLLSSRFTQIAGQLILKTDIAEYGLSSSYRKRTSQSGTESLSDQLAAYVRHPVFRSGGLKGTLESRYQRDDVEEKIVFKLQVSFESGQWLSKADGYAGLDDSGESSYSTGLSTTYKSGDRAADAYWENTLFASDNQDLTTVGAKIGYENRHFYTTASTELSDPDEGDNSQRSVATFGAQIGLDRHGPVAGGMAFTGSGAIIDVRGEPEGAGYDVYANGKRVRSGRVGSRHFVSLKPFQEYSLKLVPKSLSFRGIDRREYDFALYPGNVERVSTHTVPKYQLVTSLVDQQGNHIDAGVITFEDGPVDIGEEGVVTLKVAPGEALRVIMSKDSSCKVIAPNAREHEIWISKRPLVCFDDPAI